MNAATQDGGNRAKRSAAERKFFFYGHFGSDNIGNESTLDAILYHLRRFYPDAQFACICSGPEILTARENIEAVPISGVVVNPWNHCGPTTRLLRKVFIGIPSEMYRWVLAFKTLKGTDALIVPGTGLLTDAYGLQRWGPYNLFKWVLIAKLRGSKVAFVSVGAGPLYGALGRCLVRTALSLADFRSYRDEASLECVKAVGLRANGDRVYPDLVFSLPGALVPQGETVKRTRRVIGLGLMEYTGRYSVENPSSAAYPAYLQTLAVFVTWLLDNEYDVRLLSGDRGDKPVRRDFMELIAARLQPGNQQRIIDEPLHLATELLSQLAATDIVVATRFHNVLFALLLCKPVISISFHPKCISLMRQMGLAEYCHDINSLTAERLVEQIRHLSTNGDEVTRKIAERVELMRNLLEEQYEVICQAI